MKIRALLAACAAVISISACATPYQQAGFLGGVSASQIDAETLQITGRGNAYTNPETIQRYVLLRAAEETSQRGFDLFMIISSADVSRSGAIFTPGQATTNTNGEVTGFGNFANFNATSQTTYTPPTAIPYVKPGETVIVKMYKGEKPANAPPNLYRAIEVINFVGPTVRR